MSIREGGLEAPIRHPIDWQNPDFHDEAKLDEELRRVFDICHGCRRCFNLCDSFPRLFDLIDEAPTGELDSVESKDFKPVVDACTLCDMCFLTKCPYVPPHEFNLDFPHLMLRYRAVENRKGAPSGMRKRLTETDRNGKLAAMMPGLANWVTDETNAMARGLMQKLAHVHKEARLPKFVGKTLERRIAADPPAPAADGPAKGRKAVIYATCYGNYNCPEIGEAAIGVLAKQGVETKVVYPECCGMPQMEHGDLEKVAAKARNVAAALLPYVEDGWEIISLVPSCTLMLKFEWPLVDPDNADLKRLAEASFDISEYIVGLAKEVGLAEGMSPIDGPASVHIACHARAQNMGRKGEELARLIPEIALNVVERCSGHGGSWGVMEETFEVGMKVGRPVFRQMTKTEGTKYIASECPLAALHIGQGIERSKKDADPADPPEIVDHPVILMAKAYGIA